MTVNEALSHLRSLKTRHAELTKLRQENSTSISYRSNDEKVMPTYSIRAVDVIITKIAAEQRKLDAAIKASNAVTVISFTADESVFEPIE